MNGNGDDDDTDDLTVRCKYCNHFDISPLPIYNTIVLIN